MALNPGESSYFKVNTNAQPRDGRLSLRRHQ